MAAEPLTIAGLLSSETGHFTVQDRPEVQDAAVRFFVESLVAAPSVDLD